MKRENFVGGIENVGELYEKGRFGGNLNIKLLFVPNNIKLFEQC